MRRCVLIAEKRKPGAVAGLIGLVAVGGAFEHAASGGCRELIFPGEAGRTTGLQERSACYFVSR